MKIKLFFILVLFVKIGFGQSCSNYFNWVDFPASRVWLAGEQVHYNGKVYTPCFTSTTSPLSDSWNSDESGCGWRQWGFVTNCTSCNTVGGTTSSNATVCSGANSGNITLSGHNGSIIRWKRSTNNWSSVTSISNTTTSQSYLNITNTTKYRAVLKDGSCAQLNSSDVTVTVNYTTVGGTVSSSRLVCSGSNSGTLTLSGHTGNIVRWERSTNNWGSKTNIANTTTTLGYTNITTATKYDNHRKNSLIQYQYIS